MTNQHPEQQARERIDTKLEAAGWVVQDVKRIDWTAGPGIAVREYPTETGFADYALFIDRTPMGIIEAKREEEGQRLSTVEDQSGRYGNDKLKHLNNEPLPFLYESNGVIVRFTDRRDPNPRAREVFSFFRPETLLAWRKQPASLRERLQDFPVLLPQGLRNCQFRAINELETSFGENHPRALVQMATGAGKTFTAITGIYRLLKHAGAKRVLFLVDTRNLGEQAEQEFMAYTPQDDNRKFTELYTVQRLTSRYVNPSAQVCITTIQRLYSILQGRDLDEAAEDVNPNESDWKAKDPKPVVYNQALPPEFFDAMVIDECHRSIYNLWRQVLDYFDAFLIGLTATPDKRTFGFFNENVVSEYPHEEAVADGVNVSYDTFEIDTEMTNRGAVIPVDEVVNRRHKLSRAQRWERTEEELIYTGQDLDRDVVSMSQIRLVIRTFKEHLPALFPGREEVPKTLIFAKTDSHAEDIIHTVREEFGEGNRFCKKITYQSQENPKSVLAEFRNDFYPRIAVTVDMIATGTDVKPLECLLFMRNIKSAGYYQQMWGRGTRVISLEDLRKVTPSARVAKDHFVIVDAVGVTRTVKTDNRQLERKPSESLKNLLDAALVGNTDEDLLTTLAGRLGRLEKQIDDRQRETFTELAKGKTINDFIKDLLAVDDPDRIETRAKKDNNTKTPSEAQRKAAREALAREATATLSGKLVEFTESARRVLEQTMDTVNIDRLRHAGWSTDRQAAASDLMADFTAYIEANKDEITALSWFYAQPQQRQAFTYAMVKDLLEKLRADKPTLAPLRLWQAWAELDQVEGGQPLNELTALVALVRRVVGLDAALTPFRNIVDKRFQRWVFKKQAGPVKFSEEQMEWLRAMKDHIATSFRLDRDDLDYSPFDAKGGLMKLHSLFGDEMDGVMEEMNRELVA